MEVYSLAPRLKLLEGMAQPFAEGRVWDTPAAGETHKVEGMGRVP